MPTKSKAALPIEPPSSPAEDPLSGWLAVDSPNPIVDYIVEAIWDRVEQPVSWEMARLSNAAYLYRERPTGWSLIAKFYAAKGGAEAETYAYREYELILRAQAELEGDRLQAIRPLALWRGVLFLEYVDGFTLEDLIAIRRSRPGMLLPALEHTIQLLGQLHTNGTSSDDSPDFERPVADTLKIVRNLSKHGVLQDQPVVEDALLRLVERWATDPGMADFVPTFSHGDATTTNFVFSQDGRIICIDWERAKMDDPAADLGRLMAEVSHSIIRHGGTTPEAMRMTDYLQRTYCEIARAHCEPDTLARRMRFYQASSTLRIARNGWLSHLERTTLVQQAMALLLL